MENLDSLKIASNLLKSEREKSSLTVEEVSFELKLIKKLLKILNLEILIILIATYS